MGKIRMDPVAVLDVVLCLVKIENGNCLKVCGVYYSYHHIQKRAVRFS